jgi:GST-like protein
MTIQLFAFDTPNGRKISVALEEMGLDYTVTVVNITARRSVQARVSAHQPE